MKNFYNGSAVAKYQVASSHADEQSYKKWPTRHPRLKAFCFIFICFSLLVCSRSSANGNLLSHYASTDINKPGSFIDYYAQAMKVDSAAQGGEKVRKFYLAAIKAPDAAVTCATASCALKELKALAEGQRSGLFAYAVFHLAEAAHAQNQTDDALALLDIAAPSVRPIERKISLLKGRILYLKDRMAAAVHFRKHIETFNDADSLYFAAASFERAGDKTLALETAYKVLEMPASDSPFAQSGVLIRNNLGQAIYNLPDLRRRIRLMEALRIAHDQKSAYKLFQTLNLNNVSAADRLLYANYSSRLLISRGEYHTWHQLISKVQSEFFAAGNDGQVLDICERLLRKRQYRLIGEFYNTAPATKSTLQCQLRLALRTSSTNKSIWPIATQYWKEFDGNSTLAERAFLRTCLPLPSQRTQLPDLACLQKMRIATEGLIVGASARYYLARQMDTVGNTNAVQDLLHEIAAHYADDYYFFRLIEKPLQTQKQLATTLKPESNRTGHIYQALVNADLSLAKDTPTLAELVKLDKRTRAAETNLSGQLQIALFLLAADSRNESRELLRADDKNQVYENLITLGRLANKPDFALYGLKQWLRHNKLQPFMYEIPTELLAVLYPTNYSAHIDSYTKKYQIDPAEVLALIRQESQFFPGAQSVAHAKGLMQLLPSTAKLVAKREKMAKFDLLKPEDNIRLGIGYMRDLKEYYTSNFVGIAVAYNAGPGRYVQWKKRLSRDEDMYIEQIPFQETYLYVRVLLKDRAKYRALLRRH